MKSKNKFLFFVISLILVLTVSIGVISAQDTGSNVTGVIVSGSASLDSTSFEKVSGDNQVVSDNKVATSSVAKNKESVATSTLSDKKTVSTDKKSVSTKDVSSDKVSKDKVSSTVSNKESVESDKVTKSNNNQKIVQSNDNVKSKNSLKRDDSGTFNDLNTLITSSEDVSLDKNYVRGSTESAIVIDKAVSINGNGYSIDANKQNGTFVIGANADVTIKNVNFINYNATGSNTNGASIYVNEGKLTLVNVTFENNNGSLGSILHLYDGTTKLYNSTFKGVNYGSQGAIQHSYGTLLVNGSVFNGTTSNNGAIQIKYGSAVADVINSTFVNNHANNYGGGINNKGLLLVDNCLFENNSAGTNGGALSLRGTPLVTVQNSIFKSNKVEGTTSSKKGGAISINNGYLSLKNNTMTNNYAYNGSDICIWYADTIHDAYLTFDNTQAIEDEVINLNARVTDDMGNKISNLDVNFTINGKNYTAPLVDGVAKLSISESLEPGNYTITGIYKGAVLDDLKVTEGKLEVVQADVFKYKMLQEAIDADTTGVIKLEKDVKRGSVEDSVVVNKTITIDGNGLFINANKGRIFNVNNSAVLTLKNMQIFNTNYGEGAIANITGSSKVILNNVTIFNNTGISANNKPSSFFYVDSSSQMDINDTYFTVNNNGAILRLLGSATINNTQVTNVVATGTNDQGFIINECTSTNSLTIENSIFDKNSARLGGIYGQRQDGQLTIKNTTFSNNTLTVGSGTVWTGGKTSITNTTVVNNKATGYSSSGTAIYNKGDLTVTNSVFINNTLPTGKEGSILYNGYGGKVDITYSLLIPSGNNTALYNDAESTPTANYNWWGTNTNISKYLGHGSDYDNLEDETIEYPDFVVNYWAVLNTTTKPASDIPYNSKVEVTTTLNTYTDKAGNIKELTSKLPSDGLIVEYTSNKGSFENAQTTINDGKTTNTYTVLSPNAQINIKQANQVNTINIDTIMPTPQEYTITNSNFNDYFNTDGTIKLDKVVYGSKLIFSGSLYDKEIVVNLPVNLTTLTQADFTNLKITVLADGENTNITNLTIKNSNEYENVILLKNTTNITIKNNTITTQSMTKIHTIELINTNTTLIDNNTITTNGPSNKIQYDEYYMGYPDTSSIKLYNSYNNTISNNNVITKASTTDGSNFNTINGIEIYGNTMNWNEDIQSNYNKILNNNITTEGGRYAYSVTLSSKVNNNTVQNNKIVAKGEQYANGLQLLGPAAENIISYNNVSATAENITYGLYISTNEMGAVTNNMISYNNVTTNSSTTYVIELYGANKNTIKSNNITNDIEAPDYAMGIGLYNSKENIITDNMINVVGYEVNRPVTGDSISAENVGIKLTQNSNSNTIKNNDITSQSTSLINYAINMSKSSSNTVTENTLTATTYLGDLAVTTDSSNTVENNKPDLIITDDTYTNYFNDDGTIKNLNNGMTIYLSGEFKNKNFIIDRKLNILSHTTQAKLSNSTFMFIKGSDSSSIRNLIINNNNYSEYVISVANASVITIENNTITQENAIGSTYGIKLDNSDYNTIHNNTIKIRGLSYAIQYVNYVGFSNTSAIRGSGANYNTITENIIDVKATGYGKEGSVVDTIMGIEILGNSMDWYKTVSALNNKISKNNVTLDGLSYAYAIKVGDKADNTNISDNIIKSNALGSAYGIDFEGPAITSYITGNKLNVTAQNFTYGILIQSINGLVDKLTIDSNVVNCTSSTGYAIELYNVGTPIITNNNLTVTGNFSMGIGARKITSGQIINNTITTTGNSDGKNVSSVDQIVPENVGIKLTFNSNDNIIQNNTVTTNDAKEDIKVYTITADGSSGNTIMYNTLYSSNLKGSKSVNAINDTVRENNPETQSKVTISVTTPISIEKDETDNITVRFYDEDGKLVTYGNVTFEFNDKLYKQVEIVNGTATISYSNNVADTYRLRISYIMSFDYDTAVIEVPVKIYEPTTYNGIIYVSTSGDDSNEGSLESPKLTIRKAVAQALKEGGSHQIIVLEGTYNVNDVIINSYLNITGQGKVIFDGRNLGRIFNITSDNVVIKNIIFINGQSSEGGAIYNKGNLTLNNTIFANNTADTGGAISSSTDMTIINSTFTNNTATNGYGGAINAGYNSSRVINIIDSTFENNSASSHGGAIYESTGSMTTITNTVFKNNTGSQGGAVYLNSIGTLKNVTFTDNNSTYNGYSSYGGGAIYINKQTTIDDSKFMNNYATNVGGAIYVGSQVTITNTTISNNKAKSYGGAIYAKNSLTIINSTISNNTANTAAIYFTAYSGVLNINNTILSNNTGKQGAIIYIDSAKNFTLNNITCQDNVANNSQRLIYVSAYSATGVINNSKFINNTGDYTIYGNSKTNVTNTLFENNNATGKVLYNVNSADNTYLGNNITTTITVTMPTTSKVGTINIPITVSVDKVYNTTVNSGKITIYDRGIKIETLTVTDGIVTYAYKPAIGNHELIFVYSDENVNFASVNTTKQITINKIPTTIIIDDITTKINDSTTITIKVVDDENNPITSGKIILKLNGKTLRDSEGEILYGILNEDGTATVTTSFNLKVGKYTITAVYGGDSYYTSARKDDTTLTITPREAEITINDVTPAVVGGDVSFTVKVTDGNALVNEGRVIVKLNGKTVRDSNGNIIYTNVVNGEANVKFTIPTTFKAKTYNLTVVYASSSYDRMEKSTSLEVTTLKTVNTSLKTIDTSIITDAHSVKSNDSTTESIITIFSDNTPKAVKI